MHRFTSIDNAPQGSLAALLRDTYSMLLAGENPVWQRESIGWDQFDIAAYTNPIIGRCAFLTWSDEVLVGFASFDPRGAPKNVLIGHHCIIPSFQKKGLGRIQFHELLRRIGQFQADEIRVSTLSAPFFEAASRLYSSCGFELIERSPWTCDCRVDRLSFIKSRTSRNEKA
jgi:RimJ/RimL family protein N-acetyltransferase